MALAAHRCGSPWRPRHPAGPSGHTRRISTATFCPEEQIGRMAHAFRQQWSTGAQEKDDADTRTVGVEMAGRVQHDPAYRMWDAARWSSLGARCDLIARMAARGDCCPGCGLVATSLGAGGRRRRLPDRG